ncbi:MAG: aminodeoxychorismate lyase, partial [Betaproteobacteria bacterium]|nr:aminodeoxychorismate lyase [Betaproteobacteria bacterium]
PQRWRRQYDKLAADCGALGIVCPAAELLFSEVWQAAHEYTRASVRITVTRGSGPRGYQPPTAASPLRVVSAEPAAAASFPAGIAVHPCETRYARQPLLAGIKHLNRLENVLARREWRDADVREGLMRDSTGLVIGGAMSNVFIVERGALVTPRLDQCGVSGVTRARVFAIAPLLQVQCVEDEITLERLSAADEVFFVNSVFGLARAARMGGVVWRANELSALVAASLQADHG